MGHKPRKRFGQNFLQSQLVIGQIIAALSLHPDDKVIEIGPGQGALTMPLLQRLNRLIAIEIDRDLHALLLQKLASPGRFELIEADALTVDYSQWGEGLRIVGNLPYNISTPLIMQLLSCASNIIDMHFMLQKEVVERLAGQPGTRDYGRLSVMTQFYCDVEPLFDVPPEAFYPAPAVDSAVVRLTPWRESPYPAVQLDTFQAVVAKSFAMRRKTLANNLKPVISSDQLISLDINPGLRPEQLSVMDYVNLSNFVTDKRIKMAP